jgi:hypothetical protein
MAEAIEEITPEEEDDPNSNRELTPSEDRIQRMAAAMEERPDDAQDAAEERDGSDLYAESGEAA